MNTTLPIRTHNGTVTMTSPKTGDHRTLRVRTEKWGVESKRTIALLIGPNEWLPIGFVTQFGSAVVWKKYYGTQYDKLISMMANPAKWIEKGVRYQASTRCRVCNRELTTPESIESGIGPVCAGKN